MSKLSKCGVHDVGIDHRHLQQPKHNFPPPLHRLPEEGIVGGQLVHFVNPKHILVVKLDHLRFLFYDSPARLNLHQITRSCCGLNCDCSFVLPLHCHRLPSMIRPNTSSCHPTLPGTFNSQRHPPSISLDRSSEGQTTPLQLHGQLRQDVVAKTFIWLAECQDYACGLEKCGVNNEVSLFTKIYTEPKHIP